jgi:acetyl esterase/lipase
MSIVSRSLITAACVLFGGAIFAVAQSNSTEKPNESLLSDNAKYSVIPAVTYASPDGVALVADIYEPRGKGPFPGIVFIHGGGWGGGTRMQLQRQAEYMAERGMVGMAIEYRLAPAHPFPAALEDSRAAVVWLREHATEYHVDKRKIAAVGSSAGGHLSAMLGVESASGHDGKADVQAVVAFNGVFDFEAMTPSTMVTDFLSKPCTENIEVCKKASPIDHVQPSEPPFLILHGTADKTAPFSQAQAFVTKLKANGDVAEMFVAEGAPHTFWAQPKWLAASFAAMDSFLEKELLSPSKLSKLDAGD